MEREQLDRLLSEYATGGLSEDDKKKLFTAALADQELFDQLLEEDALRDAIEMPGARNRLIDSLQEEPVALPQQGAAASVLRMPSPKAVPPPHRKPVWLAWAAGIGVVFVSGAITYMMFEGTTLKDLAQVRSDAPKDTKPFVPPPSPEPRALKITVEEPPKILGDVRGPIAMPRPVNIPLPAAPPPPESIPAKEIKAADAALSARAERDRAQSDFRANQQSPVVLPAPFQQPQAPAGPPATAARRQAPAESPSIGAGAMGSVAKRSAAKTEEAREVKAKLAVTPPSLWRRAGDGVWFRVPAGDAIGRNDSVAIRYVPASAATVVLLDAAGHRIASKSGRAGEELELVIPGAMTQRAEGDSISLSIAEGPRTAPFKILLRRE